MRDPAIERLDRFEHCAPGIDQRPKVPEKCRNIGETDPPDDPHHGGRDVLVGILVAAEPRDDDYDENRKRSKLQRQCGLPFQSRPPRASPKKFLVKSLIALLQNRRAAFVGSQ